MFKTEQAYWYAEEHPKKASTAFTVGMLVAWDGAGAVEPATATTTAAEIVGICNEAVDASDTSNDKISISVPESSQARMRCDDVDGTLTSAMVGTTVDLSDANSVNAAASAVDVVLVTKRISATEGVFKLNR